MKRGHRATAVTQTVAQNRRAKFDLKVERGGRTLRERTVEVLRRAILDFHFRPGERLIERELCDLTGVSRTSVREALRQLDTEGLVTITPHVGPTVSSVTIDEAREIYEVRAALESLAVGLCAERASDEDIAELTTAVEHYQSTIEAKDPQGVIEALDAYYSIIFAACGNGLVATMSQSLRMRVRYLRATTTVHHTPSWTRQSVANYRCMVRSIKQRDGDAAQAACRQQIEHAAKVAFKILATA